MKRWQAAAAVACAVALAAAPARAQEPAPTAPAQLPTRRASFSWNKENTILRVSLAYRDVVDSEVERKLQSGLPTVVVMRAYLYPDGTGTPVAGTVKSCRIVFDVWDEIYRVQVSQPGGETNSVAPNIEGVLRRCATATDLAVADRTTLQPGGSYFMAALVEVNPISKEMLDRIRRWVSRPPGTSGSAGDSLFGSFVGLFVARIGQAERTLSFRTQSVVVSR
jgi:hypothetical protein